jgi:hypothetical protein
MRIPERAKYHAKFCCLSLTLFLWEICPYYVHLSITIYVGNGNIGSYVFEL